MSSLLDFYEALVKLGTAPPPVQTTGVRRQCLSSRDAVVKALAGWAPKTPIATYSLKRIREGVLKDPELVEAISATYALDQRATSDLIEAWVVAHPYPHVDPYTGNPVDPGWVDPHG